MKKINDLIKYAPIVYAVFIPLNTLVHGLVIFYDYLNPVTSTILDIIKILVIAAFAFYIIKTSKNESVNGTARQFIDYAGFCFLGLVFNTVMTINYEYDIYSDKHSLIVVGILIALGFVSETIGFYKLIDRFDLGTPLIWLISNILFAVIFLGFWSSNSIIRFLLLAVIYVYRVVYKAKAIKGYVDFWDLVKPYESV